MAVTAVASSYTTHQYLDYTRHQLADVEARGWAERCHSRKERILKNIADHRFDIEQDHRKPWLALHHVDPITPVVPFYLEWQRCRQYGIITPTEEFAAFTARAWKRID